MNSKSHSPEDDIPLPSMPLLTEEESARQINAMFTKPLRDQLDFERAEVARLENITKIQMKQIERLMEARDIEKARADELEARIANALT